MATSQPREERVTRRNIHQAASYAYTESINPQEEAPVNNNNNTDQHREQRVIEQRVTVQPREQRVNVHPSEQRVTGQPSEQRVTGQPIIVQHREERVTSQPIIVQPREQRVTGQPIEQRVTIQPREQRVTGQPREQRVTSQTDHLDMYTDLEEEAPVNISNHPADHLESDTTTVTSNKYFTGVTTIIPGAGGGRGSHSPPCQFPLESAAISGSGRGSHSPPPPRQFPLHEGEEEIGGMGFLERMHDHPDFRMHAQSCGIHAVIVRNNF